MFLCRNSSWRRKTINFLELYRKLGHSMRVGAGWVRNPALCLRGTFRQNDYPFLYAKRPLAHFLRRPFFIIKALTLSKLRGLGLSRERVVKPKNFLLRPLPLIAGTQDVVCHFFTVYSCLLGTWSCPWTSVRLLYNSQAFAGTGDHILSACKLPSASIAISSILMFRCWENYLWLSSS